MSTAEKLEFEKLFGGWKFVSLIGLGSTGGNAFAACSISTLEIPGSMTEIDKFAFESRCNLTLEVSSGSYAETWTREYPMPYVTQ